MAAGIEEEQKVLDVEAQRQQKQVLTQNSSHPRACLALPPVPAAECLFLAPPAPSSREVVEIHPDFWLCKEQPLQSLAELPARLAPTLVQHIAHPLSVPD